MKITTIENSQDKALLLFEENKFEEFEKLMNDLDCKRELIKKIIHKYEKKLILNLSRFSIGNRRTISLILGL